MRELQILSPDGKSRVIELTGDRITLGRSSAAELCFPDDTGLSRQHLAFEREGDGQTWALHDLNSKNGTILNGEKVQERIPLRSGDRVMAGHLILVYDGATEGILKPVVIFDPEEEDQENTNSSTVITNLEG